MHPTPNEEDEETHEVLPAGVDDAAADVHSPSGPPEQGAPSARCRVCTACSVPCLVARQPLHAACGRNDVLSNMFFE